MSLSVVCVSVIVVFSLALVVGSLVVSKNDVICVFVFFFVCRLRFVLFHGRVSVYCDLFCCTPCSAIVDCCFVISSVVFSVVLVCILMSSISVAVGMWLSSSSGRSARVNCCVCLGCCRCCPLVTLGVRACLIGLNGIVRVLYRTSVVVFLRLLEVVGVLSQVIHSSSSLC